MKLNIMLLREHLFPHDKEQIEELVANIPSLAILSYLAVINSRLLIEGQSYKIQTRLLMELFLRRQPKNIKVEVWNRYHAFIEKHAKLNPDDYGIFAVQPVLKFMEYVLTNFSDDSGRVDSSPEDDLKILKVLLHFNDLMNEKIAEVYKADVPPTKEMFFYEKTWPIMMVQYNIQLKISPLYQMIKGIVLMSELRKMGYESYVDKHLNICGKPNIHEYSFELMNFVLHSFDEKSDTSIYSKVLLPFHEAATSNFYDFNCVDPASYALDERNLVNFNGLKSKPLIKLQDGKYVVLHWGFLQNKLYDGLIFDFLETSGIRKEKGFTLPNFKSKFSDNIIEKILFKNVMGYCLKQKNNILHFESDKDEPDLYFRSGNTIMLFEFKDVSFATDKIEQADYESIRGEIEKKICTKEPKPRGAYQLLKHIGLIADKKYDFDKLPLPTQSIRIFPILVLTDDMFGMPGVNRYVNMKFHEDAKELKPKFKKIEDLVIIDFDFLFTNMNGIRSGKYDLKQLLTDYNKYLRGREKQLLSTRKRDETLNELHINFSTYVNKKIEFSKHSDFVSTLFNLFDLKHGLPAG